MANSPKNNAMNYTAMHVTFTSCTLKAKSLLGLASNGANFYGDWQYSEEHAASWESKGLTFIQG